MDQVSRQGSNLGRQLLDTGLLPVFSHTVAQKEKMRQKANLHIETFQVLLLGLQRVCRALESEKLHFRLSSGEERKAFLLIHAS